MKKFINKIIICIFALSILSSVYANELLSVDKEIAKHEVLYSLYNSIRPQKVVRKCSGGGIGSFVTLFSHLASVMSLTLLPAHSVNTTTCESHTVDVSMKEWLRNFDDKIAVGLSYKNRQKIKLTDKIEKEFEANPLLTLFTVALETMDVSDLQFGQRCAVLSDMLLRENVDVKKMLLQGYEHEKSRIEKLESHISSMLDISNDILRYELGKKLSVPAWHIDHDKLNVQLNYSLDEEVIFNKVIPQTCSNLSKESYLKVLRRALAKSDLNDLYTSYLAAMKIYSAYHTALLNYLLENTTRDQFLGDTSRP